MSFKDDVSISDLFFLHAVTPVLFEKTEEYNHILKNDACKIDVSWLGSFLATTLYFCKNQNRAEHEKLVNETLARNANFYKNNFSSVTDVKKLLLERNSYYLKFAFDKNNNFDLDGLLKHFLPIIVYDCKNNCLASVESCLFSTEDNDTENEKNIESEITGYFSSLVSELECVIDEYNHDYAEEKKADERDVLSTPTLNSTVAPSSAVPQYVSSYEFRNSETYRTRKVKPRTVYLICLAIIAIIALVILMTKLINNDSYEYTYISPTSQITTTVTQTATEKTILPEPENGKIFVGAQYSDDYDCSELTVRASDYCQLLRSCRQFCNGEGSQRETANIFCNGKGLVRLRRVFWGIHKLF